MISSDLVYCHHAFNVSFCPLAIVQETLYGYACVYIYMTCGEYVSKGSYAWYVCRYILDSGKASIQIKHGFQLVFCASVRNLELKSTISLAANGFVFGNGLNSQADMHAISIYKGKNLGGKDILMKAFTSYWFMYKIPCHVIIPGSRKLA